MYMYTVRSLRNSNGRSYLLLLLRTKSARYADAWYNSTKYNAVGAMISPRTSCA